MYNIQYKILFFYLLFFTHTTFGQNLKADSWKNILQNKKGEVTVVWHNAKPFFYRDKKGALQGIEYEMMQKFFDYVENKYQIKLKINWLESTSFGFLYGSIKDNPQKNGLFAVASLSITKERKKEVNFATSYMPDIEVIISSANVKIAQNLEEFKKITSQLTGVIVPNTTFEQNFQKLRKEYLPTTALDKIKDSQKLIEFIAQKDNHFGYIHLPIYALALQENKKIKRQAYYKIEREGYAMIYPLQSDWKEIIHKFFERKDFKSEMNQIIQKYLGNKVKDLIWDISGKNDNLKDNDEVTLLTKEKELQALNLRKQELENEYQKFWNNALVFGVIIILLFALVLFNRYYIKQKANKTLLDKNRKIEQQKDEIEQKNLLLTDSIKYAKRIQESILPNWQRLQTVLPESFLYYQPKDVLSGDFYWFVVLEKKIMLAVGDCTGHGVPGALMTMLGNSLLNYIVIEQNKQKVGQILSEMNSKIDGLLRQENTKYKSNDGMDISLCLIDLEHNLIDFAGAKQAIYLFSDQKLIKYKASKYAIGGHDFDNKIYETHQISFQKGDCLYMLSDGLQDQFGGNENKKFLVSRLKQTFEKIATEHTNTQKEILKNSLETWKGQEEQTDDILCIGIKF